LNEYAINVQHVANISIDNTLFANNNEPADDGNDNEEGFLSKGFVSSVGIKNQGYFSNINITYNMIRIGKEGNDTLGFKFLGDANSFPEIIITGCFFTRNKMFMFIPVTLNIFMMASLSTLAYAPGNYTFLHNTYEVYCIYETEIYTLFKGQHLRGIL
jgi:hypothetical protein